jgi:hypothetical protein
LEEGSVAPFEGSSDISARYDFWGGVALYWPDVARRRSFLVRIRDFVAIGVDNSTNLLSSLYLDCVGLCEQSIELMLWKRLPLFRSERKTTIMAKEEEILAALDKPRAVYAIQQLVDPSSKSTDALQDHLLKMRVGGKVKFDIKKGTWSKT